MTESFYSNLPFPHSYVLPNITKYIQTSGKKKQLCKLVQWFLSHKPSNGQRDVTFIIYKDIRLSMSLDKT